MRRRLTKPQQSKSTHHIGFFNLLSMDSPTAVSLLLRRFLIQPSCPPEWKLFDLYLIRDANTTFYVGQSECAFSRVWEHIHGGPHGHSILGRFILVNWPKSGSFLVELISSQSPQFSRVNCALAAAERLLIEEYSPCFNNSLNAQPHPLPARYLPPNAPIKYLHTYKRMIREAGYAARVDANHSNWGEE
jgi:hypothetical protein